MEIVWKQKTIERINNNRVQRLDLRMLVPGLYKLLNINNQLINNQLINGIARYF